MIKRRTVGYEGRKSPEPRIYKLKPYQIPDGMEIVVDTREQKPFPLKGLPTKVIKVDNGDYTIAGLEHLIAFERKQMSDFYSYIGSERLSKTNPKINRFMQMQLHGGFVGLIITEDEEDIFASSATRYANISPEVARQFLASWEAKYGLHLYMNKNVAMCERWMVDRMIKFYKEHADGKK